MAPTGVGGAEVRDESEMGSGWPTGAGRVQPARPLGGAAARPLARPLAGSLALCAAGGAGGGCGSGTRAAAAAARLQSRRERSEPGPGSSRGHGAAPPVSRGERSRGRRAGLGGWRRPRPTERPGRAERAEPSGAEPSGGRGRRHRQDGGPGGGAGRRELPDGHGEEQGHAGRARQQEDRAARAQVRRPPAPRPRDPFPCRASGARTPPPKPAQALPGDPCCPSHRSGSSSPDPTPTS